MNILHILMRSFLIVFIAATAVVWPIENIRAQEKTPSPPKFEKIEAAVWRYFQSQRDFQESMIITRDQVEPLLVGLARMGFSLPDANYILDKLPVKNEFLVVELYTPSGRKFMQGIADYPQGYDRLDRLSRLPHGKQTVHDLIRGPGGEKMIEYLTTASGGIEMGKMLSKAPRGANFNKPTGRIYTVPMLLKQLEEQYHAVEKSSAEKK